MGTDGKALEYINHWAVTPQQLARIPLDKRGLGYVRVSEVGGRGDELISPELQEHSIETFAEREGIKIVYWMYDIDRSGRVFTKRHVGDAAQGVRDSNWRFVVLWKWSRWGRNLRESLIYLAQVEDEAGGLVRAATEDFDPTTTIGRFSRSQMLLIAELQSDMMSDGWKETQAKRRRDGLPHTAAPRWGYLYDKPTGYTPHPEQAPILKDAYERYVDGEAHRKLATEWNQRGLRTTAGNPWSQQSISRMMDTGFAAGLIRERTKPPKANEAGGKKGRSIWAFDVWRVGAHEAIISRDLWERYRARRDAQAAMAPRLRTAVHDLSGLMVCGYEGCGGPMVSAYSGKHRKHTWVCYRARDRKAHPFNSISNARAVDEVKTWLAKHAEGGEDVTERARRLEAATRASNEAEAIAREVSRLTRKRKRLVDLYTDGEVEREDYLEQKGEVDADLASAHDAHKSALARERAAGAHEPRAFGALLDEWDRFTPADHREALSRVLRHIVVTPGPFVPGQKVMPVPAWEE
ncbi:recombinase family protein [Actinomycetes bacterium KLBMP 9797]